MEENKLMNRPGQVFNMDKSGMPLDPKVPRIVAERGSSAITVGSGDKSQVTIVGITCGCLNTTLNQQYRGYHTVAVQLALSSIILHLQTGQKPNPSRVAEY